MIYELKSKKRGIEHMIEIGQPILVFESEKKLMPHYLVDLSSDDMSSIIESSIKSNKPIDWKNIIVKPYEYPYFDLKNSDKIYQDTIYHMGVTLHTSDMLRIASWKFFHINTKDRSDIHKAYRQFMEIFYYSAQSDAIGLRQRLGRDDKTLVLYSPSIVEKVDGSAGIQDHVDMQNIVLKEKSRMKLGLDIYISKF